MEKDSFYDIRNVPFTSRESFNNTILLLTLVKSDYYYITGFDRPNHIIEVSFDFKSDYHSIITENVTIYFNLSEEKIVFKSFLKNILADDISKRLINKKNNSLFKLENNEIVFETKIKKDCIIPISVKEMNQIITDIKIKIIDFLEEYYLHTVKS